MFKRLGIPWYGGRTPKRQDIRTMAEKAVAVADQAIAVIEEGPRPEDQLGQVLLDGMHDGLQVGRHICRRYMERLAALGPDAELDPKSERLASDTANWMTRLGARVMEEAFKRRRDDTVGKLLLQLRQSGEETKKEGP